MNRYIPILGLLSSISCLWGTDYAFLNEEAFIQEKHLWHLESDFSKVGGAKITTSDLNGTKLHYSEGNASIYFSHFLNKENALAWQIGANYIDLNWDENIGFRGDKYLYGVTSLTFISNSLDKWRWVINGGVSVDTKKWNFGKSAVYFTTLWGRYLHTENLGLHVGFFGYYGALNGYILPILGLDWLISPKWELKAIFPIDASLNFGFAEHFTTSLLATSMGGPYRFPRRAHGGIDPYDEGIFKIYSTAVEWNLKFTQKEFFTLGGGGGWDFGGWIQIADSHGHHKQYYDFNGAPYFRVFGNLTF